MCIDIRFFLTNGRTDVLFALCLVVYKVESFSDVQLKLANRKRKLLFPLWLSVHANTAPTDRLRTPLT